MDQYIYETKDGIKKIDFEQLLKDARILGVEPSVVFVTHDGINFDLFTNGLKNPGVEGFNFYAENKEQIFYEVKYNAVANSDKWKDRLGLK